MLTSVLVIGLQMPYMTVYLLLILQAPYIKDDPEFGTAKDTTKKLPCQKSLQFSDVILKFYLCQIQCDTTE